MKIWLLFEYFQNMLYQGMEEALPELSEEVYPCDLRKGGRAHAQNNMHSLHVDC